MLMLIVVNKVFHCKDWMFVEIAETYIHTHRLKVLTDQQKLTLALTAALK